MKLVLFVSLIALSLPAFAGKKEANRAPNSVKGYKCGGTEPFFGVEIDGNKVTYSSPDHDGKNKKAKPFLTSGPVGAYGMTGATSYRTKKGDMVLTLLSASVAGGKCNDGMSDNLYDYHLTYVTESGTLYGCCDGIAK